MNLSTVEIKAFVPAADLEVSKQFYLAIGFQLRWSLPDMACFHYGNTSFLLQAFNEPAFIRNYQMHLLVENVDDWHAHIVERDVAARFGVRIDSPADRPWGMRDFPLFDPSGVLWRVGQDLPG